MTFSCICCNFEFYQTKKTEEFLCIAEVNGIKPLFGWSFHTIISQLKMTLLIVWSIIVISRTDFDGMTVSIASVHQPLPFMPQIKSVAHIDNKRKLSV